MKKLTLIGLLAISVLILSACGKKSENVETGSSVNSGSGAGASSQGSSAEADPDEFVETEFFEGLITGINGSIVKLEGDDGTTMSFDIGQAEVFDDEGPILRGSYAEAEYTAGADSDAQPAVSFSVLMDIEQQAAMEERDPVIYGKVQIMDINELQILDDAGIERSFDNQLSRVVAFSTIKTGDEVAVTYAGALLDTDDVKGEGEFSGAPYAIKIVSIDALGSDEAKADYIVGTISDIYSDGLFTLMTETVTLDVEADPSVYEGFEEGDKVKVYYTGEMSGMTVYAEKVEYNN